MKAVLVLLLLYCAVVSYAQEHGGVYGVATFNTRGVRGTIKFFPQENGDVNVSVSLEGLDGHHAWHVHVLPVDGSLHPDERCLPGSIGGHFDPFDAIGTLGDDYTTYCNTSNQSACEVGDLSGKFGGFSSIPHVSTFVDTTGSLALFGRYGIIGRSIRIHGTENVCANILSSTEMNDNANVVYLQATFVYPFGGTIYMRQVETEDVIIWGKVYWVTDAVATTEGHNWHIHAYLPELEYREGMCDNIGGHFNPLDADISSQSYTDYCNPDNITNCEVGDLSGKHGRLDVPINPLPYNDYAFLFHDDFLNLTGTNAVFNRSIAIHSLAGPVEGCAPLYTVETLSVRDTDGNFVATHQSSFSLTDVETTLPDANLAILGFAIAPNENCRAALDRAGSVYNPHAEPPLDGTADTPDRHPVGALGLKYDFSTQGSVSELPINGIDTIAGLAIGSVDGSTYTCSALWPDYPSGANTRMAKATFDDIVSGAIYFIQRDFGYGVYGHTFIFVDLWYTGSSRSTTNTHNWHIHVTPPQRGQSCLDAIGGHFNPFQVDIYNNYAEECSDQSYLRCESGDLSGKHGQLTIGPPGPNRMSYTYRDNNLNLFGPREYSIIGRSVGLHLPSSEGGALFECGAIEEVVAATELLQYNFTLNDDFDRAVLVTRLTNGIPDTSPGDLLMVKQEMESGGRATISLRVLGSSVEDANAKREAVELGSGAGLSLPSVLTLLGLLMLALLLGQY